MGLALRCAQRNDGLIIPSPLMGEGEDEGEYFLFYNSLLIILIG
jgi:hypothetical protein